MNAPSYGPLYPLMHFTNARVQQHDTFAALLTGGLCVGLVLSYLPQVCFAHS